MLEPVQGTLRERQKNATRELIVDAALQMMADAQFDHATHDELARRVGIARRTVYRYFPDRDSIQQAAWQKVNYNPQAAAYGLPTTPESVIDTVEDFFGMAEANALAVTVAMSTPQGRDLRAGFRQRRAEAWREALAPLIADLPEDERDLPLAALQLLRSGFAWLEMRDQWGLEGAQMAKAVRWASRLILHDLEARKGRPLEEE